MPESKNRFQIKLDDTVYTDPENWINFTPTTERHSIYRTLLSTFSEGSVKLIKTAKNYVDSVYANYGPSQTITVKWLEYDYLTDTYDEIYALGSLNLSEKYNRSRDFTEVGFEPVDFVMDLLNRDEIQAALQTLTDMDNSAITTFTDETHTVTLDNQIIDFAANFEMVAPTNFVGSTFSPTDEDTLYVPVPIFNSEITNDKLVTILDISSGWLDFVPDNQLSFNQNGDVSFILTASITIEYREPGAGEGYTLDGTSLVSLIYVKNNGSEVTIDSDTLPASDPSSPWPSITLTGSTIALSGIIKGDELKFYLKLESLTGSNPPNILIQGSASAKILQSTTYPDTTCEIMFPWEVFLRLCQKITGRNDCFRSAFFGRTDGEVKTYGSDGAGAFYAITSTKLLRGFPIATNPINTNLMAMFKNMDNIFLLGLGIVYESSVPYVSIEPMTTMMASGASVAITWEADYPGIDWESAIQYIWGNVQGGYSKYKLEQKPVHGSPHSPRQYNIPYLSEFSKKSFNGKCNFIASGHLIEQLRRDRYDENNQKDSTYDDDLIIIHMKRNGGGSFERKKDEDFSAVTNIDNPTTQYNLNITPARNVLRLAPLLLAGLQKRITFGGFTEYLRYQSGEANTDAETTITGDTMVPEGDDLTQAMAAEVDSSTPLFDASEIGNCQVTITKAQRVLIKEGFLDKITVTDAGVSYTGFIELIKEVDLNKSIARIRFLLTP